MEEYSIGYVLLSTQGSFFDTISPELRAVVVDFKKEEKVFVVTVYFDGDVDYELIELWQIAITEASAHFDLDVMTDEAVSRLDWPQEIPMIGHFAYLRQKEPISVYDSRLNKNILFHRDPQLLLEEYKGSGLKMNNFETGQPGPREMVNFEEPIGYIIDRVNGKHIYTNWGVIHYDEVGCHIIPALSDGFHELPTLPIAYAQLALQTALLGRAAPSLRAVCVDHVKENDLIYIRFYFDGEISNEQKEKWECVISETCADLGPHFNHDTKLERIDFPQKMPIRGRYAFLRKE